MAKYIPVETIEKIKAELMRSDAITQMNTKWQKSMEEYRRGQYSILDWLLDDLEEAIVEVEDERL